MRIIGGKYRGKTLVSPDNNQVRPTSDRAREALFNILRSRLGFDFSPFRLADVFAGSGAFGLEAVSQGFKEAALVDLDTRPLLKNVRLFPGEAERIKVIQADARQLPYCDEPYNVLFMDAPYQKNLSEPALRCLSAQNWLKKGALCLIEVEKNEELPLPPGYALIAERRYGLAKVVLAEFEG